MQIEIKTLQISIDKITYKFNQDWAIELNWNDVKCNF
jgi:hypothetical protein